jgi:GTPase KRas protein
MGHGYLLVYDVTKRDSMEDVLRFKEQLDRHNESLRMPVVLVANKIDLVSQRTVTTAEGVAFARKLGAGAFFEASAKQRVNVDEAFCELVRCIRRQAQSVVVTKQKKKTTKTKLSHKTTKLSHKCVLF